MDIDSVENPQTTKEARTVVKSESSDGQLSLSTNEMQHQSNSLQGSKSTSSKSDSSSSTKAAGAQSSSNSNEPSSSAQSTSLQATAISSAGEQNILPVSRVKKIMKQDKDVNQVSADATFLVCKATEMFIEQLTKLAYQAAVSEKKKSVTYSHLAKVVHSVEELEFLNDIIPEQTSL